MSKYIVYCHENMSNGKKYYGITSKTTDERWRSGEGYRNNEYFYRSINKHGWDQFTHTILYEVETEEIALLLEKSLILQEETYKPDKGYNILVGGNLNSEENKQILFLQKIKNGVIRKVINVDTGEVYLGPLDAYKKTGIDASAICGVCTHKKNAHTAGGYRWCYEDEYEQYKTPKSTRIVKKVVNTDTGAEYRSLHEAERETGILRNNIANVCNGKSITAGGFHWAFCEQPHNGDRVAKPLGKRVINVDTGEIFNTIKEAAKSVGTTPNNISMVCCGKGITAAGFHWKYVDNADKYSHSKEKITFEKKERKRKVLNVDLGIIYSSIREAAESCGVSYSNISAACRGVTKTSAGYHWEYLDADKE